MQHEDANTFIINGVKYESTGYAEMSNRIFPGGGEDACDGEEYTIEFYEPAIDSAGREVNIVWHFTDIYGDEEEDHGRFPWEDSSHIVGVLIDWDSDHKYDADVEYDDWLCGYAVVAKDADATEDTDTDTTTETEEETTMTSANTHIHTIPEMTTADSLTYTKPDDKITFAVTEDNGGGIHLAVKEGSKYIYIFTHYEQHDGWDGRERHPWTEQLIKDIRALAEGEHPINDGWDGNEVDELIEDDDDRRSTMLIVPTEGETIPAARSTEKADAEFWSDDPSGGWKVLLEGVGGSANARDYCVEAEKSYSAGAELFAHMIELATDGLISTGRIRDMGPMSSSDWGCVNILCAEIISKGNLDGSAFTIEWYL